MFASLSIWTRSSCKLPSYLATTVRVTLSTTAAANNKVPLFIEPSEIRKSPEKVKFLDVRPPDVFSQSHIANAVNCHSIFTYLVPNSGPHGIDDLVKTFEEAFQTAGLNQDEHVVTYENSLNGFYGASCRGLYLLKLLGHQNVSILNGGFNKWVQEGHPISKEPIVPQKGNFTAKWSPESLWADHNDITRALKDNNTVILDVRDLDEWYGTSSSPYGVDFTPRKGRIPGAVHILWKDFMETNESDGLNYFKKPKEIRQLCASKGITPDSKVIVYCFKGARASNTYVALKRAGFDNVTNYFASWNEWSRDNALPIDDKVLS